MIKPASLLAGLIGFSALLSLPAAAEIYKWTDESGATHYTETPPPSSAKSQGTVKVRTKLPDGAAEAQAARDQAQSKAKSEKAEKDTDKTKGKDKDKDTKTAAGPTSGNAEKNKEVCAQLRGNLETIGQHGRVRMKDDKGEVRFLTEEEKQGQADFTRKQIDLYCK